VIEHRKSLGVVLEKRKSLSVVIEHRSLLELSLSRVIWHYILVELSLEVQGGQDYFWFVEGTCIIACVLYFSVLLLSYPLHKTLNSLRLWTSSDSKPENISWTKEKRSFLKHKIQPPLLVVFLTITPTPPCLALYLTLRTRGYAAWERIKEVSDTTGNLKEWRQSYWLLNASELCLDDL